MPEIALTPDCRRCDALCCVLLAFDTSDAFAFDKPAGAPCRNLAKDNACVIHANLSEQGFQGCAAYSCYGAGQRITQDMFKGRSWRDTPADMPAMADAFRALRSLHEAVWLLRQAATLPLPPEHEARRSEILTKLNLAQPFDEPTQTALKSVRPFFTSLRGLTPRP